MSEWSGTQRYGLTPAPGGLALVQELINTRAITGKGTDLLADGDAASEWLARVLPVWTALRGIDAPRLALTDADAAKLRALRGTLAGLLAARRDGTVEVVDATAQLSVSRDGVVQLVPRGRGWRWLSSALWAEVLHAQGAGVWPRLKVCRNPECGSAFYDRSKNSSGVWHDVKTCGNTANLRASRARRHRRELV
jgi:hypothetical protein